MPPAPPSTSAPCRAPSPSSRGCATTSPTPRATSSACATCSPASTRQRAVDPAGGGLDDRFDDLRGQLEAPGRHPAHHRHDATRHHRRRAGGPAARRPDHPARRPAGPVGRHGPRSTIEQSTDARIAAAEQRLDATVTSAVQTATRRHAGPAHRARPLGRARRPRRRRHPHRHRRRRLACRRSPTACGPTSPQAASAAADARVTAALAPLTEQVTGLGTTVAGLDDHGRRRGGRRRGRPARPAAGRRRHQHVGTRLDEARAALAQSIADQVGQAVDTRVGDLDARVGDLGRRPPRRPRRAHRPTGRRRTSGLADQVRTEVQIAGRRPRPDRSAQRAGDACHHQPARRDRRRPRRGVEATRSSSLTDLATQLRSENEAGRAGLETRLNNATAHRINIGGVVVRPNG